MLYFTTRDGTHMVILEPRHWELLKAGETVFTPDKQVFISYTPDSEWLGEQLIKYAEQLTPGIFDRLLVESQKRPEKGPGPDFPTIHVIKDGKVQGGES